MAYASSPSAPVAPAQLQHHGSLANSPLRRRVMQCAAMAEWAGVRAAVDEQGCNINIQDEETGFSLVHWAANQGNLDAMQWLADKGAFMRLKDIRGNPPLTAARNNAAEFLLSRVYSPVERIVYARGRAADEADAALELLTAELGSLCIEALDEPLSDEGGATLALWLASRHNSPNDDGSGFDVVPMLRWLAAKGANLEAVDEDRNSLLHMVEFNFGAAAVRSLLEWALLEARVQHRDARNSAGDTPALVCTYQSPTGQDAFCCLQVFEAAGSNLALGNAAGVNVPMQLARYHGDGPWLAWCRDQAGVDPGALCAEGRNVTDYLALHGTEELDE